MNFEKSIFVLKWVFKYKIVGIWFLFFEECEYETWKVFFVSRLLMSYVNACSN